MQSLLYDLLIESFERNENNRKIRTYTKKLFEEFQNQILYELLSPFEKLGKEYIYSSICITEVNKELYNQVCSEQILSITKIIYE